MHGTPIICTPFPSAFEMGIWDKINAHVVPFDMDFDVTKLLDIPRFTFNYDNEAIRQQWIEILGDSKPLHDYDPDSMIEVEILNDFYDMDQGKVLHKGEKCIMTKQRAFQIIERLGERYIQILT